MNYTVQSGDSLSKIAGKFLGDVMKWREIWAANPQISNPDVIRAGQIIKIPGQSTAQSSVVPYSTGTSLVSSSGKLKLPSLDKKTMFALVGAVSLIVAGLMMKKKKAVLL